MKETALTFSIVACKTLTRLESHYIFRKNWWKKCPDTYNLYLMFISTAVEQDSKYFITKCSSCNVEIIVDKRAKKNNVKCHFGCRKKQKNEKCRLRKITQRAKERAQEKDKAVTQTNSSSVSINDLKTVKLNDTCQVCVILIAAYFPHLNFFQSKLFGIIAFMSRSIKFSYLSPELTLEFDEKQLWEKINELDSG